MKVTPRQIKCRTLLEAQGYPRSAASAITGNFCVESGPDLPSAFRTRNLDHGSNGLPQWRLGRLTSYCAFVKSLKPELIEDGMTAAEIEQACWPWYGRMDFQVRFVAYELKRDYPALHAKLMEGGDVAALTADVCWQYERPNKALSHIADRIAYAKAIATENLGLAPSVAAPAASSVVDHLHVAAAAHAKQKAGGVMLAAGSAVAGAGLVISNFVHLIPTWELIVLGVLALLVVSGMMAAVVQARHVADVKDAIAGVSKVPPPSAEQPVPVQQPTTTQLYQAPTPVTMTIGQAEVKP